MFDDRQATEEDALRAEAAREILAAEVVRLGSPTLSWRAGYGSGALAAFLVGCHHRITRPFDPWFDRYGGKVLMSEQPPLQWDTE